MGFASPDLSSHAGVDVPNQPIRVNVVVFLSVRTADPLVAMNPGGTQPAPAASVLTSPAPIRTTSVQPTFWQR